MASKYVIKKSGQQFFFNLHAGNGEKILTSEMYNSKQGCQGGIASCRTNSQNLNNYTKSSSSNGQYYFVLKASNGEPIGRSEMYTTVFNRDKGIEAVKENGSTSSIEDLG